MIEITDAMIEDAAERIYNNSRKWAIEYDPREADLHPDWVYLSEDHKGQYRNVAKDQLPFYAEIFNDHLKES